MDFFINISYIVASILFIFGIKMLGSADTARRGNMVSSLGMLLAVVVTLLGKGMDYRLLGGALIAGAIVGGVWARAVKMTGMPELVALFNGFGGFASLLVGWAEYHRLLVDGVAVDSFTRAVVFLAVLIGGVTVTGSLYAFGKLSGRVSGRAQVFAGQKTLNIIIFVGLVLLGVFYSYGMDIEGSYMMLMVAVCLALALGIFGVMPIGGGDMPVVISLLNSLSGLAAAAAGFVILNNVLIVAGCLVGCSGLILTIIMCKGMNRTLPDVLFSGFGAADQAGDDEVEGEMKAASIQDAYYVLESAQKVVIIPGYGMAVAQAQHAVKELGQLLEDNGTEVLYAIHPVAGRMPGHMNVLLAEADVPYEQLIEMDTINPQMDNVDVAIVIGANDVVNPAAAKDQSSPIYGMPIIEAHRARTVYALKRGKGAGFSGLINKLYFLDRTRMLYGDAKATVSELVTELKNQ